MSSHITKEQAIEKLKEACNLSISPVMCHCGVLLPDGYFGTIKEDIFGYAHVSHALISRNITNPFTVIELGCIRYNSEIVENGIHACYMEFPINPTKYQVESVIKFIDTYKDSYYITVDRGAHLGMVKFKPNNTVQTEDIWKQIAFSSKFYV